MRVLIADDHELLRDFFEAWLRKEGIEIVAACNLDVAMDTIRGSDPFDLVLLDFRMPGMNHLDGLVRLLDESKGAPVALMSGNAARDVIDDAFRLGAVGYLSKAMPPQAFVDAVRRMVRGEKYLPEDVPQPPQHVSAALSPSGALTRRERDVLEKLSEGQSDADIARGLGLGEPTVRLHLKTLCRKLGAQSPREAADLARAAGIL